MDSVDEGGGVGELLSCLNGVWSSFERKKKKARELLSNLIKTNK
jgi:hypothetical protein